MLVMIMALLCTGRTAVSAKKHATVNKEKKVTARYTVQPSDRLIIDNVHGNIYINSWTKNEITVDISVSVKGRTEAIAQAMLDGITFTQEGNENGKHEIYYKTEFGKLFEKNKENEMTIDYVVNMPAHNPLDIENKFGNLFLDDFEGKLKLDLSFGNFTAKKISGADKKIKVSFGSVNISSIESGRLDVAYSGLTIDNAGTIVVKNMYGKSNIGTVQSLDITQRYGDLTINSVHRIEGGVDYANATFGSLSKSAELIFKYCGAVKFGNIGAAVDLVKINSSFSSLSLSFDPGADISVDMTMSFSGFKNSLSRPASVWESMTTQNGNTRYYEGKLGRGDGKMKLTADYGSITLR